MAAPSMGIRLALRRFSSTGGCTGTWRRRGALSDFFGVLDRSSARRTSSGRPRWHPGTSLWCTSTTGRLHRRRRSRGCRPLRYASTGVHVLVTAPVGRNVTPFSLPVGAVPVRELDGVRVPGGQPGRLFVFAPSPGPVSGGHGGGLDRQEDVRRPVRAPLPPSTAIWMPPNILGIWPRPDRSTGIWGSDMGVNRFLGGSPPPEFPVLHMQVAPAAPL